MIPVDPQKTPPPFDVEQLNKFWEDEEWDKYLPQPGFIRDFVTSIRGIETPTQTAAWTAAFLLSSVMKRESWFNMYPGKLYPNLYVIIVGPPRIVPKTTAVNYGAGKILQHYHKHLPEVKHQYMKEVNMLRNVSSPEAVTVIGLAPKNVNFQDPVTKKWEKLDRGSQLSIIVSELGNFLGKQKYKGGLIDLLTNLYDCPDKEDNVTLSRGELEIRNVFFNLFGATTEDGLEASVPPEAFGHGFMSRLIPVYTPRPTRSFYRPRKVTWKSGEDIDWPIELQMRLAWIARNSIGEYNLTDEADEYLENWYASYHKRLERRIGTKEMLLQTRFDTHLLKIAMVMRAQRYEVGRMIELGDLKDALRFLNATYKSNYNSIEKAVVKDDWTKKYNKIVDILERFRRIRRKDILMKFSPFGGKASELDQIITQLVEEGKVKIFFNDKELERPTKAAGKTYELYEWQEKKRVKVDLDAQQT